jgi:prevent-host-death family protein
MSAWQFQDAKGRFSEVVDLSLREGPQMVTRRGEETVVVLSVREYRWLTGHTPRLIDCLLNAPHGEALVVTRPREPIRDLSR